MRSRRVDGQRGMGPQLSAGWDSVAWKTTKRLVGWACAVALLPRTVSNCPVRLSCNISARQIPQSPQGITVSEMDMQDPEEARAWVSLVNQAYDDCSLGVSDFRRIILRNPYWDVFATYWAMDERGQRVGAVSVGLYKGSKKTAGVHRIAVLPSHRRRGIGTFIVSYALWMAHRKKGARRWVNYVAAKRTGSLRMHFGLGFVPEFGGGLGAAFHAERLTALHMCGADTHIGGGDIRFALRDHAHLASAPSRARICSVTRS